MKFLQLLLVLVGSAALPSVVQAANVDAGAAIGNPVFKYPKVADELAKTLLAQPAKDLGNARVLRGRFIYAKYLSEIPAPLISSGEFVFLRTQGLYWHTLKPFESVFVLTPKAMTQQDEGGKALTMAAADQPAVRAAAQIFMALFAVDLETLNNDFYLFGAAAANGWQLGLRPKNASLGAVFAEAIVSGASQVRQVELWDAHGDRTVIQLVEPQLLARPPTAQEQALLAQ